MTTKETPNAHALRDLLEGAVGRALKPGSTVESVLDEQRERYGRRARLVRHWVDCAIMKIEEEDAAGAAFYARQAVTEARRRPALPLRLDPAADPR